MKNCWNCNRVYENDEVPVTCACGARLITDEGQVLACDVPEEVQESVYKPQIIGKKIRKYREKAGMTQEQLSEYLDLTRMSVTNIESGRQHMSLRTFMIIADTLKVDVKELLP
jgi:DNA-binding XRE family transcriptional regulator